MNATHQREERVRTSGTILCAQNGYVPSGMASNLKAQKNITIATAGLKRDKTYFSTVWPNARRHDRLANGSKR
jgi:hypothetical protein